MNTMVAKKQTDGSLVQISGSSLKAGEYVLFTEIDSEDKESYVVTCYGVADPNFKYEKVNHDMRPTIMNQLIKGKFSQKVTTSNQSKTNSQVKSTTYTTDFGYII